MYFRKNLIECCNLDIFHLTPEVAMESAASGVFDIIGSISLEMEQGR